MKASCASFSNLKTENGNRNANPAVGRLTVISQIHSPFFLIRLFAGYLAAQLEHTFPILPCRLPCLCNDVPANGRRTEVSVPLPDLVLKAVSLHPS